MMLAKKITFDEMWDALSTVAVWQETMEEGGTLRAHHDRGYRLIHSWGDYGEEKVIDIFPEDEKEPVIHLSLPLETRFYSRSDNIDSHKIQEALRQLLMYATRKIRKN